MFFRFMAATVRQSRKGFRVELVTGSKKNDNILFEVEKRIYGDLYDFEGKA